MTSGHDSILEIFVVIPLNKRYHENDCIIYIIMSDQTHLA
jgi:hypothetical protein